MIFLIISIIIVVIIFICYIVKHNFKITKNLKNNQDFVSFVKENIKDEEFTSFVEKTLNDTINNSEKRDN